MACNGTYFDCGRSMKNLLSEMAYETHTSKNIFGLLYFPYLIQKRTIDNKIDPHEFAEHSNLDEKTGEALAKEMDRTKEVRPTIVKPIENMVRDSTCDVDS